MARVNKIEVIPDMTHFADSFSPRNTTSPYTLQEEVLPVYCFINSRRRFIATTLSFYWKETLSLLQSCAMFPFY